MRCGKLPAFVAGILVGLTLSLGGLVAAATALEVDIPPLKFFVDGVDSTPPGGSFHNGSKNVPAGFVHEGTPYVPVQFVSQLVGKEISWRQQDSSIWIGSQWPGRFIWYTDLKPGDYISDWQESYCTRESWSNTADAWNLVWDHGYALKCERWSDASETIRLDGRFKQFTGVITLHAGAKKKVLNNRAPILTIYVDDKPRYVSPTMTPTSRPVPFSVEVAGAKTMRFVWEYGNDYYTDNTPLGLVDMKFFYNE